MQIEGFRRFFHEIMPRLDGEQRRIALSIYRSIAKHGQAPLETLAKQTGLNIAAIGNVVSTWPAVYRDAKGDVVGFWGLTAQPVSKHMLHLGEQTRYAWCAWDCLFIPALLDRTVRVSSICPQTGESIELTVSPTAVESVRPQSAVLSLLVPDVESSSRDVISTFCYFVYFFKDRAAGEQWTAAHPGTQIVTMDQGMELARAKNEWQYGAIERVRGEVRSEI